MLILTDRSPEEIDRMNGERLETKLSRALDRIVASSAERVGQKMKKRVARRMRRT